MDLARLRTLRELAARNTMAAVAEASRLSSSAVSQQIAQLEIEAGLPLIERRGRGVRLTAAGERLCFHADHIVAILEEARTDLAELKNQIGGEVRIASEPGKGTTVRLYLPRSSRLSERPPRQQLGYAWSIQRATKSVPLAIGAGRER